MSDDIFNLKDLSDLPKDIVGGLMCKNHNPLVTNLLDLFIVSQSKELNLDQITVALFRKHDLKIERSKLNATLYKMHKKGMLVRTKGKKGVYSYGK